MWNSVSMPDPLGDLRDVAVAKLMTAIRVGSFGINPGFEPSTQAAVDAMAAFFVACAQHPNPEGFL